MSVISAAQEVKAGGSAFEASPNQGNSEALSQKQNKRGGGGVSQVVEHLPSIYKTLDSAPSMAKKFLKVV
jgi:hypothetical protein